MIGETFNTTRLIEGIQGNLTVELRDASTNKIQEEVRASNFIAQAAIRRLKWLQRANYFKDQISALNAPSDQDYQWPEAQSHIVLSSSVAATNSSNEWQMFGKLAGYAGKYTYSGLDTLLGSPNATLCEATPTYTKWVFDWPTSAGNGVIGSVGWMTLGHTYRATVGYPGRFYTSCSVQDTKSTAGPYWRLARVSSTQYFSVVASVPTIIELNENFEQTNSFSVGSQFKASTMLTGIAWDNNSNKLWVLGINSSNAPIIASYNSSGTLQDGPITITNRSYSRLTFDGTHLWTLANISSDSFTLYRISTAGSDVSNIPITLPASPIAPGETAYALSYEPSNQYIYVATSNNYVQHADNGGNNSVGAMRAYDLSGNEVMVPASLYAWRYDSGGRYHLHNNGNQANAPADFDMIDSQQFIMPQPTTHTNLPKMHRVLLDGLGSRALLPSPITKTSAQTLRITYQMDYT